MPGVLVDDQLDPFGLAYSLPSSSRSPPSVPLQQPLPARSSVRHYIPVLTRATSADSYKEDLFRALSELSPLSQHCGGSSHSDDVKPPLELLKCQEGEDGALLEPSVTLQFSPVSGGQWGNAGSPTLTEASLVALEKFLPSDFEGEAGDEEDDSAVEWAAMDMYSGDEFRMYEFKVRRCMRGRSHDWTECPFAHPGEKARRRDPRRFHYSGTACADFRKGSCKKGDACELAHGIFESWLHPARYRTQPCKDGRCCRRRVCFFAHTREQLRLLSPPSPSSSSSLYIPAMEASLEAFNLSASSPSSTSSLRFPFMEAPVQSFPVSGPSLSLRLTSMEASTDVFPSSGPSLSSAPVRFSAMEPPAEAFTAHASSLQSEACCNQILSASLVRSNGVHGFSSSPSVASPKSSFSGISPVSLSPPLSPSFSPPESPIDWSSRGPSNALPTQLSAQVHPTYGGQSLRHSCHIQTSLSSVPAHCRHLERLNPSLSLAIPPTQNRSFSALPSPTSSSPTGQSLQQMEDLVCLLKHADLTQRDPLWLQGRAAQISIASASMTQQPKFLSGPSPLRRGSQSVPATPTKMGFRSEGPNLCYFDDDGEASEPKLERVESGRGLRAQIFESLMKSCTTDQGSNTGPVS